MPYTEIFGQKDVWGGKQFTIGDYKGLPVYVNGTGDLVLPGTLGFYNSILGFLDISVDTTGTYSAQAVPSGLGLVGVAGWRIRWTVLATGTEVTNGTNLSNISVKMSAVGF